MPLYEYVCADCDSKFEVLRPASSMDDPADCPRDRGAGRRIMSTFAAVTRDPYASGEPSGGGGGCGGGCSGCNCGAN